MHTKPGQKEPTILVKFVSAGLAASVAEAVTIPIDTAKVRLQVSDFMTIYIIHVVGWFDRKTILHQETSLALKSCELLKINDSVTSISGTSLIPFKTVLTASI